MKEQLSGVMECPSCHHKSPYGDAVLIKGPYPYSWMCPKCMWTLGYPMEEFVESMSVPCDTSAGTVSCSH